ncbi:Transcription elongation factor B polypeptide 3 [Orchesella cincta]|uniref:Transcription elongation factor B polypeptide 3 n=1 Tax=Orchesella cincta TaxID=48709 RepID=A0A1D2MUX7_ORCCI|nr:Transcription elongation factor B polypeptide 3 [Orchesella cincta]
MFTLLHYLGRLSRLRITVQDLAETGIGRTVNQLSRNEGPVGSAAETLVRGWKRMVSDQQNQAGGGSEESDSNSNSESSEDDEEEEDEVNNEEVPYDIQEQEEVAGNQEQQYRNGHSSINEERGELTEPAALQSKIYADEDDDIDDVDDPYLDNGYLDMANIHTDEEEEEDDDDGNDSDTSDRLQIADDAEGQRNERKEDTYPKHDKHYNNLSHPAEENRDHKSSHSKSHHRSHENSEKYNNIQTSKSNHHLERSEKASSSSKDPKHQSSKLHNYGDLKERPVIKQEEQTLEHKSQPHPSTSSKSEKSKEFKSESSSSAERSHHKEKDRHRHDKHSRESSSHREKDGNAKSEKERHKDKKDSVDHHHRSSSHHRRDKNREASSSSHSPKKSSLEIKKPESSEDRKRRENSESPASASSKKSKLELKEEIDSTSGVNFADVLGSLDTSSKHKKPKKEEVEKPHKKHESHSSSSQSHKVDHHKKHHSPSSSKHSRESSSSSSSKKYDSEVTKMIKKPTHGKVESVIKPAVTISPNYKPSSSFPTAPRPGSSNGHSTPLPLPQIDLSDLGSDYAEPTVGRNSWSNASQEDALSTMLSSRNARSKVYSGVKTGRRGAVPALFDLCMQVIKDNIGDLGYTGGIPYDILRPALERANPQQLMNIEAQNDYLIGETDELWQFHCKRDFRGKCPEETESWRELYERCTDEQKRKFEQIKKQMKRSIESAEPVRKAKLAFVDTSSGPRFSKQKAQTIKNGMRTLKMKEEKGPKRGVSSSASVGFNNPKGSGEGNVVLEEAIIIAAESRAGHAPAPSVSRESSVAKFKPKKAPLMQKTMKLIRSLNRR